MLVLVGERAPSFEEKALFSGGFEQISLENYRGKEVVLFFYPFDFTFGCSTELNDFQEQLDCFLKEEKIVLGCSVGYSTDKTCVEVKEKIGIQKGDYGLILDRDGNIAKKYNIISKEGTVYLGLFLIDKEGVIRFQAVNGLFIKGRC